MQKGINTIRGFCCSLERDLNGQLTRKLKTNFNDALCKEQHYVQIKKPLDNFDKEKIFFFSSKMFLLIVLLKLKKHCFETVIENLLFGLILYIWKLIFELLLLSRHTKTEQDRLGIGLNSVIVFLFKKQLLLSYSLLNYDKKLNWACLLI